MAAIDFGSSGGGGSAAGVSQIVAGAGVSVLPAGGTGVVTVGNSGVTQAVAGAGISVSGGGVGATTITNTGVTSIVAGTAVSISGATGAVTVNNIGVTSAVAGAGIGVSGATGAVTFTNNGVTSAVAGAGIGVSGATGAVTFSASVTQLTAGTGISVSGGGLGNVTVTNTSPGFANPMTTAGDLIVGGVAGAPGRLASGAVGTVLSGAGAGVAPTWSVAGAGGNWTLQDTQTPAAAANVVFATLGAYKAWAIVYEGWGSAGFLRIQVNAITVNYVHDFMEVQTGAVTGTEGNSLANSATVCGYVGGGSTSRAAGTIIFPSNITAATFQRWIFEAYYRTATTTGTGHRICGGGSQMNSTVAASSLTLTPAAGTLTGTFYLYGLS